MNKSTFFTYLLNCFLLLIPVLIWNIAFRHLLPEAFSFDVFWHDLPPLVFWGENIFRLFVFAIPMFMPLKIYTKNQKIGLAIYFIGLFLYFLSWRPLILYPLSDWSLSLSGFMAPSVTPFIIFLGISLIGSRLVINIPYRRMIYMSFVFGFTVFYIIHSVIIYDRHF